MDFSIKRIFMVVISTFCLFVTFDTVWVLNTFLSYRPLSTRNDSACQEGLVFIKQYSVLEALVKDILFLELFILQHSLMVHSNMQWLLDKIGLGVLTRCVYVLATCASLQGLIHYWQSVSSVCFWNFLDGWSGMIFWYMLVVLHVISWLAVYGGCLLVDVGELIGVKQVLYDIKGLHDPLTSKSEGLRRYYKHMRHPSFIGFTILLWGVPQMSLDRFLLALQLTLYMFLAWNTDERDIAYLRYQMEDKEAHANGDWHHATYSRKQH